MLFVRGQFDRVAGQHIGPVREPGHAAEALCFALGRDDAPCDEHAEPRMVFPGLDAILYFQQERVRHAVHDEVAVFDAKLRRRQRPAVQRDVDEFEVFAE